MSAAEKLGALDEAMTDLTPFADGRFVSEIHVKEPAAQSFVALRNALPQIVAVTLAAERTVANSQLVCDEEIELARALEDLTEVLS